jgi:hypothetical protein
LVTAKNIDDEYEKIVNDEYQEHPLISLTKFNRTVASKSIPGLRNTATRQKRGNATTGHQEGGVYPSSELGMSWVLDPPQTIY